MAAHWRWHDVVNAVQATDVVLVAVGQEDSAELGTSQALVVVEDALGPLPLLVTGIDEDHLCMRVTDKVIVAATGMEHRIIVNVHHVNMRSNLHRAPQSIWHRPVQSVYSVALWRVVAYHGPWPAPPWSAVAVQRHAATSMVARLVPRRNHSYNLTQPPVSPCIRFGNMLSKVL